MNSVRTLLLERARDVRAAAGPVPSPCNAVCRIDPVSGWCQGCWRTIEEITAWSALDETARRAVWQVLEHRAAAVDDPELS